MDSQHSWKQSRALTRRLALAKLHVQATLEDVDYRHPRGLERSRLVSLAHDSRWVRNKHNVILTGPAGVGKTYLACALAHKACRDGYSALYKRCTQLFRDLQAAHADGSFPRLLGPPGAHRRAGAGRFRADTAEREPAARFAGNLRRPLQPALDRADLPAASGQLACADGRSNHGRQHPRPLGARGAQLPAGGGIAAQDAGRATPARGSPAGGGGMRERFRIKPSAGAFFAAGEGFEQALAVLSDPAFKLFAHVCLRARRPAGTLEFERAELARQLGKSRSTLGRCLQELVRQGVCRIEPAANQHRRSRLTPQCAFLALCRGRLRAGATRPSRGRLRRQRAPGLLAAQLCAGPLQPR